MNYMTGKLELTAPAGGWDQLAAAVNAGADSVYMGYKKFSARAYAENFDIKKIKKALYFAHGRGVKVYLTLNTLIKDSEIEEVIKFLNEFNDVCFDGIIIQDYGIYKLLKDLFNKIPVHASTQLNIHNIYSLKYLKELDFKRVILSREMSLNEIRGLCAENLLEVEVFGHGSQCYSYSGSCYLSSFIGGRSGNRGRCTQPCRMKYKLLEKKKGKFNYIINDWNYLLSKNDLCVLDMIPEFIKAGINAIKVEGRMKSPEYVGIVTKIYRKYIDMFYGQPLDYKVEEEDFYKISQIFSREMGTGYLKDEYPKKIISLKKSGSIGNFLGRIYRITYEVNNHGKNNKIKSVLMKSKWEINEGDIVEIWTKRGSSRVNIKNLELISKQDGRYKYKIIINNITGISEKDRVFKYFDKKLDKEAKLLFEHDFSHHEIKNNGIGKNSGSKIKDNKSREYLKKYLYGKNIKERPDKRLTISAHVYDHNQIKYAAKKGADHVIYSNYNELLGNTYEMSKKAYIFKRLNDYEKIKIYIDTPSVLYDSCFDTLKCNVLKFLDFNLNNFKVSNPGMLRLLSEVCRKEKVDINIYLGSSFNLFNSLSAIFFKDRLAKNLILKGIEFSPEMNLEEISKVIANFKSHYKKNLEFSIFGHGYFPVMNSRYKVKLLAGKNIDDYYIEDIKGYRFPGSSDYNENMVIFNSKIICTLFELDNISGSGVNDIVISSKFLEENDFFKILKSYSNAAYILFDKDVAGYRNFTGCLKDNHLFKDYTRGHLLRGVE